MVLHAWIEKQVAALTTKELKAVLGRDRLRLSRAEVVRSLMVVWEQKVKHCHFKKVHAEGRWNMTYAAFMHRVGLVARLLPFLETRYREEHHIVFDEQTIVDTSLLPSKEEASLRKKDWENKQVTVRKGDGGKKFFVCGEKWLLLLNSKRQMVYSRLMNTINDADANVFKQPYIWYRRGLKKGLLLADRGFSSKAVRSRIASFKKTLPGQYDLRMLSPPRTSESWKLTDEEKETYASRWAIEEVFRKTKDTLGLFKVTMKGVRRGVLRKARIALATLEWNILHTA